MGKFVELHCHSNYSMLDGASHPEDLVARARELGMEALAITDHDGLYGAVRFWQAALQEGIRPIIGAEMTMDGGYHLVLLARDRQGYANLCRLISASQLAHGKNQASLSIDLLAEHAAGLTCLSGCRKGEPARHLLAGSRRRARAAAERYLRIFGHDDYWIELQHHLLAEDDWLCSELSALAVDLGVGCVATNDVHYAWREGQRLQDILVCIKNRATLDASEGLRLPNSEYHLKAEDEMAGLFKEYPGAVANSRVIAERCQVELNFKGYRFPGFRPPEGETPFSYLYRLCNEGTRERYRPVTPAVSKQLAHELEVIYKTGLAEYFLIVWDIMRYAREQGIPGQGRGSAADSLVAYLLGITKVDPIRHNLLFERFLSEEMTGMPDIDIDFSTNHRERIIQYVYEKYGQDHTGMVCNVVTYRARNALREVGKAMGLPLDLLGRFAKAVNRFSPAHLETEVTTLAAQEGLEGLVDEGPWRQLLEFCRQIEGFPRHLSIHVGGMLITATPLNEIAPLERATAPGRVVVQFNKDDVEDMGLIKMDLLGLRTLSVIYDALELIREGRGIKLDLDYIPLDDPAVFDMLCEADNIGVFQVESRAQSQTLPKMQPRTIEDLIVEISIIRPGPLQGNMVHPYLRRRAGKEEVAYLHPSLAPVLGETLGVVLFQEQVIRVATVVAGFSPGEADMFRRAMNRHRSGTEMARIKTRFIEGAIRNGLEEATAETIFQQLAGFASYGFCKSHAAAFAKTAYDTAYLKRYYAPEFYTAILNNQPMGFYSPEVVANDAKRHGIRILPVDVNRSRAKCTVETHNDVDGSREKVRVEEGGKAIRLGFGYVHGLGEAALKLLEEQHERGPYGSIEDFLQRTRLSREAVENLIAVGAMDCFGRPRREMLWEVGARMQGRVGSSEPEVSGARVVPDPGGARKDNPEGVGAGLRPARRMNQDAQAKACGYKVVENSPLLLGDPQNLPLPLREGRGEGGGPTRADTQVRPYSKPVRGEGVSHGVRPGQGRPGLQVADEGETPAPRAIDAPGPAALPLDPSPAPALPALTTYEETAAEYSLLGLSPGRHAVELFRPILKGIRAYSCGEVERLPRNLVARVGGLVVCEQAPPTAKGYVFLTLEDETGLSNVILRSQVYQRYRRVLQTTQIVVVEGLIQREDGITNVQARKVLSMEEAQRWLAGLRDPRLSHHRH